MQDDRSDDFGMGYQDKYPARVPVRQVHNVADDACLRVSHGFTARGARRRAAFIPTLPGRVALERGKRPAAPDSKVDLIKRGTHGYRVSRFASVRPQCPEAAAARARLQIRAARQQTREVL